jgi:hypothetical protein
MIFQVEKISFQLTRISYHRCGVFVANLRVHDSVSARMPSTEYKLCECLRAETLESCKTGEIDHLLKRKESSEILRNKVKCAMLQFSNSNNCSIPAGMPKSLVFTCNTAISIATRKWVSPWNNHF